VALPTDPYSENAETIEAVLTHICRRHRLSADEADEFSSVSRLKMVEHDYAVIRAHRGQSSLRTFLTTVVINHYLDWRNKGWGRYRNSAEAKRLGPLAMALERLVERDGHPYEEAVQLLLSLGTGDSQAECDRVWAQLPHRGRRRMIGEGELETLPEPVPSPDPIVDEARREFASRAGQALVSALREIPPQDQLLVRLYYLQQLSMARIASVLDLEQKPLYRRRDRILEKLKALMAASGVTDREMDELLGAPRIDVGDILEAELGNSPDRPSTRVEAGGGV